MLNFFSQFWNDPRWYNFISGPLANVTLVVAVGVWWRNHTCHVHGCWRFARHGVEDTPIVVCRKHHPRDHLTADDVNERFKHAQRVRLAKDRELNVAPGPDRTGLGSS